MPSLSILGLTVAALSFSACDGVKFNRGSKTQESKTGESDAVLCGNEQFAKFKFPADIRNCIAPADGSQGHIYHFPDNKNEKGTCTNVVSSNFKCGIEEMKAAVTALGMSTAIIDAAVKNHAFLVGCGEKNGGKTIVAQWYISGNNEACEYAPEKTKIITHCFKQYIGTPPPAPTTEEEKRQIVSSCLSEAN